MSVPFGENTRYDLVIDDGCRLARVQCKTGRLREGAIRFATCSSYAHHARPSHGRRDYLGQVDYFAIYCPETNGVYLVPIEEMTARAKGSLRVTPAQNGQRRRVRLADDYEVGRVCIEATRAPRGTSGAR